MHALVEPHFDSAALLTIDVQVHTLDGGPLEILGTSAAVPRIARLCQAFRRAGLPIVHIVRIYRADGSNAEPIRKDLVTGPVPVLRSGTPGRLLAPGLAPDRFGGGLNMKPAPLMPSVCGEWPLVVPA